MATEPNTIELKVGDDPRLAAGAGGVARYLADAAGLDSHTASQLQAATAAACAEAFQHLTPRDPLLKIVYARHEDRIEIAFSHKGSAAPAVGLDFMAGFAHGSPGGGASRNILTGVDRVQYDTRDGEAVTRLTKYIGHHTANT